MVQACYNVATMEYRHYIIVGNRKFEYIIKPQRSKTVIVCNDINFEEKVANEEVPEVLVRLPKLIINMLAASAQKQTEVLRFRVTPEEKQKIMQDAVESGYDNISSYIRDKLLNS